MYLCIHISKSELPTPFIDWYRITNSVHSYNTRNSSNIYHEKCRTDLRKHSIKRLGADLWNTLSLQVKSIVNLSSFKYNIVSHILNP